MAENAAALIGVHGIRAVLGDMINEYLPDLGVCYLRRSEREGAAETLAAVLAMPTEFRIGSIILSIRRVRSSVLRSSAAGNHELQKRIAAAGSYSFISPPKPARRRMHLQPCSVIGCPGCGDVSCRAR